MEHFHSEEFLDPPLDNPEEVGFRRFARDILEVALISLVLFLSINAVSARIRVESVSMQPTLFAGNFVVVNKLSYRFGEPERGDIIVFEYPPDPEQDPYIKRVIGLPGEQVKIADGKVTINGVNIQEPYLVDDTQQGGEWTIPDEAVFVMGDNRRNSSDSRSWGVVPLENVIGKALVVYWPPEKWELLSMSYAVAAEN
ncbi:MAG TPA: signal peptidase I [Anaerolineales bacterium]|nr:signal peptidase I [Anaerolineales bacterium]